VSNDGIWLGDLLADGLCDTLGRTLWNEALGISLLLGRSLGELWDTLGRTLWNEVLGISLHCHRLGRSLGEKVGNNVLGISLGESLGYVIGSDGGIRLGDLPTETLGNILGISLLCRGRRPSTGDTPFSKSEALVP
jgi:hypothetical protein